MSGYILPTLYAMFIWWFSTGFILFLDGLPRRTFRWSMLGATVLLAAMLQGLAVSAAAPTVAGAYCAFTCAVLVWAWQEMAFLMGFLTGPRKQACERACHGWRHFLHAIGAILYHELAIIVGAALVVAVTWGQPNQIGTWTFLALWGMRQSAKLNLFLGVRNLNDEWLPDHLAFLKPYLTKRPMNLLFPFSITIATIVAVLVVQAALAPGASEFEVAGLLLLGSMLALGILEHWFLVLPLPADALWRWVLRGRDRAGMSFGGGHRFHTSDSRSWRRT
jgi:putative photosynthetic complex assembly protein 2